MKVQERGRMRSRECSGVNGESVCARASDMVKERDHKEVEGENERECMGMEIDDRFEEMIDDFVEKVRKSVDENVQIILEEMDVGVKEREASEVMRVRGEKGKEKGLVWEQGERKSRWGHCGRNMRPTEDLANDPDYFFLGAPSLYDRRDHAEMLHQVKERCFKAGVQIRKLKFICRNVLCIEKRETCILPDSTQYTMYSLWIEKPEYQRYRDQATLTVTRKGTFPVTDLRRPSG